MQLPNARREGLIVEELAEETLVYDLDTHRAHSLNSSATLVWRHCDGRTSVSEMAQIMHDELKAPASEELVMLARSVLERGGSEEDFRHGGRDGFSRTRVR